MELRHTQHKSVLSRSNFNSEDPNFSSLNIVRPLRLTHTSHWLKHMTQISQRCTYLCHTQKCDIGPFSLGNERKCLIFKSHVFNWVLFFLFFPYFRAENESLSMFRLNLWKNTSISQGSGYSTLTAPYAALCHLLPVNHGQCYPFPMLSPVQHQHDNSFF